ncbi:hypothetical protein THAOC_05922 [Thalassiosira oceanica]|uniref:Uncharacterized protein n=1 Tax=Thalassiosira oceanica TaxID=159749 RepID=K0T1L4_THAOC|nr:hypothetical protein THAOC_05922 [Thalassiosira oceanica]|eukprot:EJK72538.1 hypothetical protein THAOC_05922 [Thalassiosira oceanica]
MVSASSGGLSLAANAFNAFGIVVIFNNNSDCPHKARVLPRLSCLGYVLWPPVVDNSLLTSELPPMNESPFNFFCFEEHPVKEENKGVGRKRREKSLGRKHTHKGTGRVRVGTCYTPNTTLSGVSHRCNVQLYIIIDK